MINTRLVMALEELFKRDPFDLENDTFIIHANRGVISVAEFDASDYAVEYEEYCDIIE